MPKTIYVFTNYYPFGNTTEDSFLSKELKYLSEIFEKIILVPRYQTTNDLSGFGHYAVDLEFQKLVTRKNRRTLRLFFAEPVLRELLNLLRFRKTSRIRKLWWSLNTIQNVIEWGYLTKLREDCVVFYTYWLTDVTTGLAFALKEDWQKIHLISRVHGYDLYEERASFHYFPLREFTLRALDRLFLISQNGLDYMCSKYPKYQEKYELKRLGVEIPQEFPNGNGEEKVIQLVSCSGLRPVKRIGLLCDAINSFGVTHADWQIQWNHFGGGDPAEENRFREKIQGMPINVQCVFWGQVPNQTVIDYYRNNHVDFFLSVSESEGIPVSMMEAMSFGIPVIGTAVGGVPELVTEENGYLLPANPSVVAISNAIWAAANETNQKNEKRKMCRRIISQQYNAEINFLRFAEEIRSISDSF